MNSLVYLFIMGMGECMVWGRICSGGGAGPRALEHVTHAAKVE